jgi:hypothetical protein
VGKGKLLQTLHRADNQRLACAKYLFIPSN